MRNGLEGWKRQIKWGWTPSLSASLLLVLLCISAACASASYIDWYIDDAGGDDLNTGIEGKPFQSFTPLCSVTPGSSNLVTIKGEATLNVSCSLQGSWSIICDGDCSVMFDTPEATIIIEPASHVNFQAISLVGTPSGQSAFTVKGAFLVFQNVVVSSMLRPFVILEQGAAMSAAFLDCTFTAPAGMEFEGFVVAREISLIEWSNSVVRDSIIRSGSVFQVLDNSILNFNKVIMQNTILQDEFGGNLPKLIRSTPGCQVFIIECSIPMNTLVINNDIDHPNMFELEGTTITIERSNFTQNQIRCLSFNCSLQTLLAITGHSTYNISHTHFELTTSTGCGNLHIVESSGILLSNTFSNSVISGEPEMGPSIGSVYPPMAKPTVQATVCLTRRLENLIADFASQLHESNQGGPDGTGYHHNLTGNIWSGSDFSSMSEYQYRSRNGVVNTALYPTELWASNVDLMLIDNSFSEVQLPSVRVDACTVQISSKFGDNAYVPHWIDFGSSVQFPAPLDTFKVNNLAIYGAAPGRLSEYTFEDASGEFLISPDASTLYNDIITAGSFSKVLLHYESTVGSLPSQMYLGSVFSEHLLLADPAASGMWQNSLRFQGSGSAVWLGPDTRTVLLSILAPLQLNELFSSVSVGGTLIVPRLSSPTAAGGPRPATINAYLVKAEATSTLEVTDLFVNGNFKLFGALSIEPSLARDSFHGLNITGKLSGLNASEKELSTLVSNGAYLSMNPPKIALDPYAPGSFIPFLVAREVENFYISPATGFMAGNIGLRVGQIQTWTDPQTSIQSYRAGYVINKVKATSYRHKNGASIIVSFGLEGIRSMEHGIDALCGGFFDPALVPSGLTCQWIDDQNMQFWSSKDRLPLDLANWPTIARWEMTHTWEIWDSGFVALEPQVLLMYVPPTVPRSSSFWLDASPSFHLGWTGAEEPLVTWSIVDPLTAPAPLLSLINANEHVWRFEVPATLLPVGNTCVFEATIMVPSRGGLVTAPATVSVTAVADRLEPERCLPPHFWLDAPAVWHVYEGISSRIRVKIDPACVNGDVTFPVQFLVNFNLGITHNPHRFGTPWLTLPAGVTERNQIGPDVWNSTSPLSTLVTITVIAINNASITIPLQVHPLPPAYVASTAHDIVLDSPVPPGIGGHLVGFSYALEPSYQSAMASFEDMLCPMNQRAFEFNLSYPDPLPASLAHVHPICFNGTTPFHARYANMSTAFLAVPGFPESENWFRGEYAAPVTAEARELGETYKRRFKVPFRLVNPGELPDSGPLFFGTTQISSPSSSFVISAFTSFAVGKCTACTYSWRAEGFGAPITGNNVHFSIPFGLLGGGQDIPISVTQTSPITLPSGVPKKTMSKWTFKTRSKPFGGNFTVETTSPGYFRASAHHWSTESPSLSYAITQLECDGSGTHRLLAWPKFSAYWDELKLSAICPSSATVALHVWDGIGAMTTEYATLPGYAHPEPTWTSESLVQFASDAMLAFNNLHWDEVLTLFYMLPSVKSAPKNVWLAAKDDFKANWNKLAFSSLLSHNIAILVANTAFGDPDLLTMIDSQTIRNGIFSFSPPQYPALSAMSSLLWPSWYRLLCATHESYFGPNVPAETREANVKTWATTPPFNSRLIWNTMLNAGSDAWVGSFDARYSRYRTLIVAVDEITARNPTLEIGSSSESVSVSVEFASIRNDPNLSRTSSTFALIIISDRAYRLMPASPLAAPHPKSASLWLNSITTASVTATFTFQTDPVMVANNPQLQCAIAPAYAWLPNRCNTIKAANGSFVSCQCTYTNANRKADVALLNPSAFCPQPIPTDSDFVCVDGAWVLQGSVETPIIAIPPTTVTIIGNLTVDTISFNGLGSTVNVTGCTKIGTQITIELTLAELEALIASGEITTLLLTTTGCDISDLKDIPISLTVNSDRCEKVSVTSESTTTTLSGVFKIDDSGCKKKSSTWWIVLVSVLGGIIILAIIFILLATLTPLKHIVRPHAKRAADANTYYINDDKKA